MTSRRECYVYLQMPQSMEVVTCGKFVLDHRPRGPRVGRLVYGRNYRMRPDAVPIDPVNLPLSDRTFETTELGGLFGAIRDSGPDAWGRKVIERQSGHGRLHELDYILEGPEDRAGALSFGLGVHPPAPRREFNRIVHLDELRQAAAVIEQAESGEAVQRQLRDLMDPTTSLGGARPKNGVETDDGLWVAKFPAREDRWNHGPVEAAMLDLARECGIRVPEARVVQVGDESVLLVRRFDRQKTTAGYFRHRMLSALTLLRASENAVEMRNWSYPLLADELRRISCRPDEDRRELYRRMVFNALISNHDDHPRNHAVIAPGAEWELSPAYDLTPGPQHALERRDLALVCGERGREATATNLISQAPRFAFTADDAGQIIAGLSAIIAARWRGLVMERGGSRRDVDAIESAFNYPGLFHEPWAGVPPRP
jgi:serine/threonine-protein kinase HipA